MLFSLHCTSTTYYFILFNYLRLHTLYFLLFKTEMSLRVDFLLKHSGSEKFVSRTFTCSKPVLDTNFSYLEIHSNWQWYNQQLLTVTVYWKLALPTVTVYWNQNVILSAVEETGTSITSATLSDRVRLKTETAYWSLKLPTSPIRSSTVSIAFNFWADTNTSRSWSVSTNIIG